MKASPDFRSASELVSGNCNAPLFRDRPGIVILRLQAVHRNTLSPNPRCSTVNRRDSHGYRIVARSRSSSLNAIFQQAKPSLATANFLETEQVVDRAARLRSSKTRKETATEWW